MRGLGTIVNVLAVLLGGILGIFLKGGLKPKFQEAIMKSVGLAVMFTGLSGALSKMLIITDQGLETQGTMMMILCLVLGAACGEWINIEEKLEHFGQWLKVKIRDQKNPQFVDGFVNASLIICVGAMAVVGALNDGISGDATMLYAKSILDFVIVLVISSTTGKGAIFSAIPLGIYQGGITLLAGVVKPILTQEMLTNLSLVGSVMIFAIGINQVFGKKIKVGNLLPGLIFAIIAALF